MNKNQQEYLFNGLISIFIGTIVGLVTGLWAACATAFVMGVIHISAGFVTWRIK